MIKHQFLSQSTANDIPSTLPSSKINGHLVEYQAEGPLEHGRQGRLCELSASAAAAAVAAPRRSLGVVRSTVRALLAVTLHQTLRGLASHSLHQLPQLSLDERKRFQFWSVVII